VFTDSKSRGGFASCKHLQVLEGCAQIQERLQGLLASALSASVEEYQYTDADCHKAIQQSSNFARKKLQKTR